MITRRLSAKRSHVAVAGVSALAMLASLGSISVPAAAQGWNPFSDQQNEGPPSPRRPRAPASDASVPNAGPLPPQRPLAPMEEAPAWGSVRQGSGGGVAGTAPPAGSGPTAPVVPRPGVPGTAGGPGLASSAVEQSDLPPLTPDGPGVAAGQPSRQGSGGVSLGTTIDWAKVAKDVAVPLRSAALSRMLLRLSDDGDGPPPPSEAIVPRAALLYRAGRTLEADAGVVRAAAGRNEPVLAALGLRLALAAGDRDRACQNAATVVQDGAALPLSVRGEAIAAQGYCAASAGNQPAAGLSAQLGREQGAIGNETLQLLEAVAAGDPAVITAGQRLSVLDWRLAELSGKIEGAPQFDKLDAAVLRAIGTSAAPVAWRVPAAEAAARLNAIDPAELAEAYRQQAFTAADLAQGATAKVDPALRRALLFRAAETDRTPLKRTRLVRTALDDARRLGIYRQVAAAMVRIVDDIRPIPEVGWFAETAVEIALAAGRPDLARRWIDALGEGASGADRNGPQPLGHWMALVDISDASQRQQRGASLAFVEEMALRGRFTPDALHRLATVLDALDYHVPMRLWEAASRSPQPTSGFLPPTGVLPELQASARKRDIAETILVSMRALGPEGPEGAHMIALGDVIRGLKRAGLEAEARAVATEALFPLWPRTVGN